MSVPLFTAQGVLPPGDYALTFAELRASHLVTGAGNSSPTWDGAWRGQLVDNLEALVRSLWAVGIERVFADGSFMENKDHPRDIDGYFECELRFFLSSALERQLEAHDPGVWTWNSTARLPHPDSLKSELPMWHRYRMELYPHTLGQRSGIKDKRGHDLGFPAAFRQTRRWVPKGIVREGRALLKSTAFPQEKQQEAL